MKVIITVNDFHPDRWYLEHYLARELARLGHEVHIFTFKSSKIDSDNNADLGFTVHRLPSIATIKPFHLPSPRAIAYIAEFVRRKKPDIIHCQPIFSPLSIVFFGCRAFGHYKIVGSLITGPHSIDSIVSTFKYLIAKIVVEHYAIRQSRMVFAKSEGLRKLLLHMFDINQEKISVVPLGADSNVFSHNKSARIETRVRLGIDPDDVVVISSGKLEPSKRIDDLMKALAPIIRKNRHVKLLIRGGGEKSYLNSLKELSKDLDISENVLFHSWVSRLEIPDFFSASDIAVWPSGASISMVEAASTGLPLISMKSPIEAYALSNDNGFIFELGDITELRRLLRILIYDEKLRKEMGYRSRVLVEKKLNWRTITQEYINHYMRVLK